MTAPTPGSTSATQAPSAAAATASQALSAPANERRQHTRISFQTPAQLAFAGGQCAVVVVDISLKGALIRLPTDARLDAGTTCRLLVALDETGGQIEMDARIAHFGQGLAGLVCQLIDIDSATHLRRLVELNLGDPALLERELSALIAD